MVTDPRGIDSIYDSIRTDLENDITKVTNFTPGSFNNSFLLSYSDQLREAEIKALAAELAGYVEFAGKTITTQDLQRLGVAGVSPQRINRYMDSRQLDLLAENYGVSRETGSRSSGEVIVETSQDVTIENGDLVGTEPDIDGNFKKYYLSATDADNFVESSNSTVDLTTGDNTVTVVASEPGQDFNVGPGSVTYLPNPKAGVQDIRQPDSISGGEDIESNSSLRGRVKQSIFSSGEGGTRLGLITYIEQNASSSVNVSINEFEENEPPFVDVVVNGGDETELLDLIDRKKPIGMKHNLVRPSNISIDVFTTVTGSQQGIDSSLVRDTILSYLADLEMGESFSSSALINEIISSQQEIFAVPTLNTYQSETLNEQIEYDGSNTYSLSQTPLGTVSEEDHYVDPNSKSYTTMYDDIVENSVEVDVVINDSRVSLTKGSEFYVNDSSGDGNLDTIEIDNGVSVDSDTTIRVTYEHNNYSVSEVVDENGNPFTQSTDYGLSDEDGDGIVDSIDWGIGGETPDIGDRFYVDYVTNRSFEGGQTATNQELFVSSDTRVIKQS